MEMSEAIDVDSILQRLNDHIKAEDIGENNERKRASSAPELMNLSMRKLSSPPGFNTRNPFESESLNSSDEDDEFPKLPTIKEKNIFNSQNNGNKATNGIKNDNVSNGGGVRGWATYAPEEMESPIGNIWAGYSSAGGSSLSTSNTNNPLNHLISSSTTTTTTTLHPLFPNRINRVDILGYPMESHSHEYLLEKGIRDPFFVELLSLSPSQSKRQTPSSLFPNGGNKGSSSSIFNGSSFSSPFANERQSPIIFNKATGSSLFSNGEDDFFSSSFTASTSTLPSSLFGTSFSNPIKSIDINNEKERFDLARERERYGKENGRDKRDEVREREGSVGGYRYKSLSMDEFLWEAGNQQNCRDMQEKIETDANFIKRNFHLILEYVSPMMTDMFGNFLFQAIVKLSTIEERKLILNKISGEISGAALKLEGSRSLQCVLDNITKGDVASYLMFWNSMKDSLTESVIHTYANHICQRILQLMPLWICEPLVKIILGNLSHYCRGRYSCYVVQRCFDLVLRENEVLRESFLQILNPELILLMNHEFANYAIQYIFSNCPSQDLAYLYTSFTDKVILCATDKFGSNCIDTLLTRTDDMYLLRRLLAEIQEEKAMATMLKSIYGVSVLIRAVKVLSPKKEGAGLARSILSAVSKKNKKFSGSKTSEQLKNEKLHPKVNELIKVLGDLHLN